MSIDTTSNIKVYLGDGTTLEYDFDKKFIANTDLDILVLSDGGVTSELEYGVDFNVSGAGLSDGGTVTLIDDGQDWIDGSGFLKTGYKLFIRRIRSLSQGTSIRNQGTYYPATHEDTFDDLKMVDQQQQEELDRSVKLPKSIQASTFDPTLPEDTGDGGRTLIENSDGDAFEWGPTSDEISSAQSYAVSASTAKDAAEDAQVLAEDWASETSSDVNSSGEYSAKEHAIGSQTRGASGGGSSKDWASYVGGTVDDSEYSSKYYSQQAAASAASAASQLASAFFTDAVFYTNADSPITLDSDDNGKLHVFDSSGGAITVNFPEISGETMPFNMAFLLATAGNSVTFNRGGSSDTIGGATSKTLSAANTGFQAIADTDPTPDTWSVLEFGSVGDGTVTRAKLAVGATPPYASAEKSSAYTVDESADDILFADSSGGAFTFTMDTEENCSGRMFTFIKTSSDFNAVTINDDSATEITTINTEGERVTIFTDGTDWYVFDRYIPSLSGTYTPTFEGSGGNPSKGATSIDQVRYWREGQYLNMALNYHQTAGGSSGSGFNTWSMPSGLTMDSTQQVGSNGITDLISNSSASIYENGLNDTFNGQCGAYTNTKIYIQLGDSGTGTPFWGQSSTIGNLGESVVRINAFAKVKISGWKS